VNRLIKLIMSTLLFLFDLLKKNVKSALGKKSPGSCVVLYYHTVTSKERALFAAQMDILIRKCIPISPVKLFNFEVGNDHVLLTFDDGYDSMYQNVIPEIKSRNIPMVVFIPSGCLGQHPAWENVEENLMTNEVIVDTNQLIEMKNESLITIGSHCITHPDLNRIDDQQARIEIFESKSQLEKILKDNIRYLSYPFGSYSIVHNRIAKEAGYWHVFNTLPERLSGNNSSHFVIGRVRVDPTDWPMEFYLKLLGAYRWLPLAFSLKRKLLSLVPYVKKG